MSLSPRSIELQGLGFGPQHVALHGFALQSGRNRRVVVRLASAIVLAVALLSPI